MEGSGAGAHPSLVDSTQGDTDQQARHRPASNRHRENNISDNVPETEKPTVASADDPRNLFDNNGDNDMHGPDDAGSMYGSDGTDSRYASDDDGDSRRSGSDNDIDNMYGSEADVGVRMPEGRYNSDKGGAAAGRWDSDEGDMTAHDSDDSEADAPAHRSRQSLEAIGNVFFLFPFTLLIHRTHRH